MATQERLRALTTKIEAAEKGMKEAVAAQDYVTAGKFQDMLPQLKADRSKEEAALKAVAEELERAKAQALKEQEEQQARRLKEQLLQRATLPDVETAGTYRVRWGHHGILPCVWPGPVQFEV